MLWLSPDGRAAAGEALEPLVAVLDLWAITVGLPPRPQRARARLLLPTDSSVFRLRTISLSQAKALCHTCLMKLSLLCLLLTSFSLMAQQPGVSAVWDTARDIEGFSAQVAKLKPLLDQMTPREWVAKGAPDTYVSQWQNAQQELEFLSAAAGNFQKQPERLTAALDTYFRLQAVEWRLESLIEAVRKYQNPAVADLILGTVRSSTASRDGLRQYITDLAQQKEQEFTIIDQEAQRCRTDLLRPAAPAKRNTKQ
jgi:hypothetical protein